VGRDLHRRGVTLLEVLLAMMIIAILAMIIIPRIWNVRTAGDEVALRTALSEMRSAIEHCRGDTGGHPPNLNDLLKRQAPGSVRVPPRGRPVHVIKQDWHGPYLNRLDGKVPRDPATGRRNWRYDPITGEVRSRSPHAASDGTFYSDWCTSADPRPTTAPGSTARAIGGACAATSG
jgi:prepilin-type N-terminal cleavage/methylation domain-containing protein